MKKLAIMFVMLLGSVATMQAQSNTTFDFSCAVELEDIVTFENSIHNPNTGELTVEGELFAAENSGLEWEAPSNGYFQQGYIYVFLNDDGFEIDGYDMPLRADGVAIDNATGLTLEQLHNAIGSRYVAPPVPTTFNSDQIAQMVAAGFVEGYDRITEMATPNHYGINIQLTPNGGDNGQFAGQSTRVGLDFDSANSFIVESGFGLDGTPATFASYTTFEEALNIANAAIIVARAASSVE